MSHYDKQNLYHQVRDLISKEDFEHCVQEEITAFNGLIDETTAALIVVDKLDPHFFSSTTVAELETGSDATLYAAVDYIGDIHTFDRGGVVNVVIGDPTGRCVLVLWDANVGWIDDDRMKPGSVIKIINGYVREGFYGLEVNIGKWGLIDLSPLKPSEFRANSTLTPLTQATRGVVDIAVTVRHICPTQIYLTEGGESFAAIMRGVDISGERDITLWNKMARDVQDYQPGDSLCFSRLYVKQGTLHGGDISAIVPLSP